MTVEIEEWETRHTPNEVLQEISRTKVPIASMYLSMIFEDGSTKSHVMYANDGHLIAMLGALRTFIDERLRD